MENRKERLTRLIRFAALLIPILMTVDIIYRLGKYYDRPEIIYSNKFGLVIVITIILYVTIAAFWNKIKAK